jgi:putative protease
MTIASIQEVELLAPAGNFEKLEIVLHYGADAVYLAGKAFSLRNFSGNFNLDEIAAAVEMAHAHQAKAYVAVNIFARQNDLAPLSVYLQKLKTIGPDAIIVADPAIISLAGKMAPNLPIHLSTQANTTNIEAVKFWRRQGVQRINAARELTLDEIKGMAQVDGVQIEAFVHGAMCISYSGRCLLSNYMAKRPSNQGMCCQPCRFQYAVVEETRPGQYFKIAEDERGTYIFNSRDLCMLSHLPQMIQAGIYALKIEGRMKGIHYAATAVKTYREAIDHYFQNPGTYRVQPYWQKELAKISNRGYCTGFYLGESDQATIHYQAPAAPPYTLAGKVLAPAGRHRAHIEVRNQIRTGESVEVIKPAGPAVATRIARIIDRQGDIADLAQPSQHVTIEIDTDCERLDLIRRPADDACQKP